MYYEEENYAIISDIEFFHVAMVSSVKFMQVRMTKVCLEGIRYIPSLTFYEKN